MHNTYTYLYNSLTVSALPPTVADAAMGYTSSAHSRSITAGLGAHSRVESKQAVQPCALPPH